MGKSKSPIINHNSTFNTSTGALETQYRTFNPLTPNDLYMRCAVTPLYSRTTYTCVANCVSKFGVILFTPIRLNAVARDASVPLKVRLSYWSQNVPPPPPKPHHKHRYMYLYTGCNGRNEPNFGRVFLMLNYTEKTQNTYIQS